VEAVIDTDVSRVDGIKKNPSRVRALLRSLARNISTEATMSTIRTDMSTDDETLSEKSMSDYMRALRRIFVLDELPAWNPALRSKTAIRTTPTRHFVDPSLAVAVLRTNPDGLLHDFETFGLLFESLCVRDLRIYAQANDGELYHYRDKTNLEADAVVVLHDGRWAAIEVKLGSAKIDEAATHLKSLVERVDVQKMTNPSFLAVVTGTEFAYRRPDGVFVIPLGCLRD
jgi:predicted AAA+ superfamily ATPase